MLADRASGRTDIVRTRPESAPAAGPEPLRCAVTMEGTTGTSVGDGPRSSDTGSATPERCGTGAYHSAMSRSYDRLIAESGLVRHEARALMERVAHRERSWLIAHGDEDAPAEIAALFEAMAHRRRRGEPLAYLVTQREFHGRDFDVDPAVLIPRADTELIVDLALERAPRGARVIDLGTGSGCIAVTLACERPDLAIVASDASGDALAVAYRNAQRLCPQAVADGRIVFRLADWWAAALPGERFDVAVSNPPYIASADPHLGLGDLRFEPAAALTDFGDGLGALRAIALGAPAWLQPGGWLLLEHGWDQGPEVRRMLATSTLTGIFTARDAEDRERCTGGRVTL